MTALLRLPTVPLAQMVPLAAGLVLVVILAYAIAYWLVWR